LARFGGSQGAVTLGCAGAFFARWPNILPKIETAATKQNDMVLLGYLNGIEVTRRMVAGQTRPIGSDIPSFARLPRAAAVVYVRVMGGIHEFSCGKVFIRIERDDADVTVEWRVDSKTAGKTHGMEKATLRRQHSNIKSYDHWQSPTFVVRPVKIKNKTTVHRKGISVVFGDVLVVEINQWSFTWNSKTKTYVWYSGQSVHIPEVIMV
jgi:hypothetical protein